MPGWQRVQEQHEEKGFTVISVAFDARGNEAVAPWVEAASPKPTYPVLVDQHHLVSELYGMVNVPMATWIDEDGYLVRPVEAAGTTDSFRNMDRTTGALPDDVREELSAIRRRYIEGLGDWIERGPASPFAFDRDALRERLRPPRPEDERARALFQLGEYLAAAGESASARRVFDEALQLAPHNWSIRRQALNLEHPEKAGGPEFWAAVDALGDDRYYPPIEFPD